MASARGGIGQRSTRATPRNSDTDNLADTTAETPFANLRQLAGIMKKPSSPAQKPSSGVKPLNHPVPGRTPSAGRRTPSSQRARPALQNKLSSSNTPHIIRALQSRRAAALTPGRSRRRSGRPQRETPRDTLRSLSKVLAPGTQPVQSSPATALTELPAPSPAKAQDELDDELDDEPPLPVPELSLPLDNPDEESIISPPPDFSIHIGEENLTQRSIELPREAFAERFGARLPRASFGSIRFSDRFADVAELGVEDSPERGGDVSSVRPGSDDYEDEYVEAEDMVMDIGDDVHTRDLQRVLLEESPHSQTDAEPPGLAEDADEPTFAFTFPPPIQEVTASPEPEIRALNETVQDRPVEPVTKEQASKQERQKTVKLSRHGIPYPSLPSGLVKKLATTFARMSGNGKSKISKDTLGALMDASEWFLEQVSDDLGAYAKHAGRKTIEESDMITLMRRQRQINATTTPFSLAQRYLPRELLQEIRMPTNARPRRKRRKLETVEEDKEE